MPDVMIAQHTAAGQSEREIRKSISDAWKKLLADAAQRKQIEALLIVDRNSLKPDQPPINIKTGESGVTGLEGALLLYAAGWLTDIGKDLAKDAIKAALRKIWRDYLLPKMRDQDPDVIGDEKRAPGTRE